MAPTVGSRPLGWGSWGVLAGLSLGVVFRPVACVEEVEPDPLHGALEAPLAQVPVVVDGFFADFNAELLELHEQVLLAQASPLDEATWASTQAEFEDVVLAWQHLELVQFGPLGSSLEVVAGEDLRDEVYSWPEAVNGCRVDQETVAQGYLESDFLTGSLVNAYGLDALEHLLFAPVDTVCPSQTGIQGEWDAMSEAELMARRAAYAQIVVEHIAANTDYARQVWADTYGPALVAADGTFSSRSEALNAVYDGLFYLELVAKDRKLAHPVGVLECAAASCPEDVELPLSQLGIDALLANVQAGRTLYEGAEGAGIDDLLVELGHQDVAEAMAAGFDAAEQALVAQAGQDLADLVVSDPEAATALHTALKQLTDVIKGDLATVLSLQLPGEAAGDND